VPGQDILTVYFMQEVDDPAARRPQGPARSREAARDDPHTARMILAGDVVPIEAITDLARRRNVKMKSMTLLEPTLEDVFIHYTGRGIRDAADAEYSYKIPSMMR
jgi:hypothetical protein